MRIRHTVVEYDLEEAAAMLNMTPEALKHAVKTGRLRYYYCPAEDDYRFHEASLRANKDLLAADTETTTVPDASEEDPPSTPSDP